MRRRNVWKQPEIRAVRELNQSGVRYRDRVRLYGKVGDLATAVDCVRQADFIHGRVRDRMAAIRKSRRRRKCCRSVGITAGSLILTAALIVSLPLIICWGAS